MHVIALPRFTARLAIAALVTLLGATACEHNPTGVGSLASIVVTRNPDTLAIGTVRQFTAVGKDANGNIVGISPSWSVAAGGGAINSSGAFTAGMVAGNFANTVTATVGSLSGTASLTVVAGPAATITLTPSPVSLAVGAAQQFTAVVKDIGGNVVSIAPSWAVSAGGGTINSTGMFTAGTTTGLYTNTVSASIGTTAAFASVTVTGGPIASITLTPNPSTLAVGGRQQFTAVGKDASGNVVAFTPFWSVEAGGGTIDGAGMFTAGGVIGTFANTVRVCTTAACGTGSISALASVTVGAGALATITVTPTPVNVVTGASQQFTAVGKDAGGNVVPIAATWSVAPGNAGGTVGVAGLYTAPASVGVGFDTIRASSAGITGSARANIQAGNALASIVVTPDPAGVLPGGTVQFTATGYDGNGNVIATPGLTWTVVAGGGTIGSGSGLFTAGAATGSFPNTVQATSGGITGDATVNVVASGALATITVTPNPASLVAGDTVRFTAVGRDAGGAVVATPGLVWTVVAGGGTINALTGLFTAGASAGTFPNTVRATSGTIFGSATVTVTSPPQVGISLGAAATHGILAGSTITCASAPGTVNADASVWPGTAITGFPPCVITGARHAGDAFAQTAQGDLTTAYLALAAMPCGSTIAGDLGGRTLAAGVYCSTSSVSVTGPVTLTGPANAVFVIKAASTLTTAGSVILAGGAQAKNVYWLVGSSATLGTGSAFQGNIIAFTSITLVNNVTLVGRALARNGAVTLGTNTVITLP
jgi:hypothetical protein